MEESLRYLAKIIFNAVLNFLDKNQLYSLKEEDMEKWKEVKKCKAKKGTLPFIFWEAPSSITLVLGARRT